MKITVIQVNNELASTGVSVYVDGQLLGSIGPGGSVSASVDASACRLLVSAGFTARSSRWSRAPSYRSPGASPHLR